MNGLFNLLLVTSRHYYKFGFKSLFRQLAEFPGAVQRAAKDMRPHYIAGYALELATRFNEFYQAVPVLSAGRGERLARLALVRATAQVLRNALGLLGIEAPERM